MSLPDAYRWLLKEPGPKILLHALRLYGTIETPGQADNPIIISWAKEVGSKVGMLYKDDSIPWCGLFIAVCAIRSGYVPPDISVRAGEWSKFGNPVNEPMLGDILVFQRTGGGHVGLYVGEDADCYHVLGGNQGDAVSIVRILKSRCIGIRRSHWKIKQPSNVRRIILDSKGKISDNEA